MMALNALQQVMTEREQRQAAAMSHPYWTRLFLKVARAEADQMRPLTHHYRNRFITVHFDGPDAEPTVCTVNYRKTLPRFPGTYGSEGHDSATQDAFAFAELMAADDGLDIDMYPAGYETVAVKETAAYLYVLARDYVRARLDARNVQ